MMLYKGFWMCNRRIEHKKKKLCHESDRMLLVQCTNHKTQHVNPLAYIQKAPTTAH